MNVLSFILTLFLAVNIGLVYFVLFFGRLPDLERRIEFLERRVDTIVNKDTAIGIGGEPVTVAGEMVILSDQQKDEIAELTADLLDGELASILQENLAANPQATPSPNASVGEYYIPIGQATARTQNSEWKDLPVEIQIDTAKYGQISSITFEGTMRIPTGNGQVHARLFDSQTGAVAGSEIVGQSSDGVFVRSSNLILNPGSRTLRLQMKTTLDYDAILENARLKITSG